MTHNRPAQERLRHERPPGGEEREQPTLSHTLLKVCKELDVQVTLQILFRFITTHLIPRQTPDRERGSGGTPSPLRRLYEKRKALASPLRMSWRKGASNALTSKQCQVMQANRVFATTLHHRITLYNYLKVFFDTIGVRHECNFVWILASHYLFRLHAEYGDKLFAQSSVFGLCFTALMIAFKFSIDRMVYTLDAYASWCGIDPHRLMGMERLMLQLLDFSVGIPHDLEHLLHGSIWADMCVVLDYQKRTRHSAITQNTK